MFLDKTPKYNKYFLSEAGDEPMEADAGMGGDDMGMGEPPAEPSEGQSSDAADQQAGVDPTANNGDMGGNPDMNAAPPGGDPNQQGGMGDTGGGYGDTSSMGSDEDAEDKLKKRRLFKDYKELFFIIEDLQEVSSNIPYENLSPDARRIYDFIEKKMNENYDKIKIVLTEQFASMEYKTLMMLFMYFKTAVKTYAELLKYFSTSTKEH